MLSGSNDLFGGSDSLAYREQPEHETRFLLWKEENTLLPAVVLPSSMPSHPFRDLHM